MRRQGWWTRYLVWRQSIVALAVLCTAVVQGVDRYQLKPDWTWVHSPEILFTTVAIAGGLVLVNTVGEVVVQKRTLAGESRRLDLHKPVIAAIIAVSADTQLPVTDLGANVFLVKKGRCRTIKVGKKSWCVGTKSRLERVERVRLSDYPASSDVTWTEGKGVIGDCWRNARPEYVHWAPLAKRWHDKKISDKQWAGIKEEDKAGFSLEEFMTMVGKYAEIKAVPIKNGNGGVLGIVALDRVWRSDGRQDRPLASQTVEETMTSAAVVLHNVLGRR